MTTRLVTSQCRFLFFSDLMQLRCLCSVRKEADAKRLQAEFGDFFTPLLFDVTDEEAVTRAAAEVRSRMKGHFLLGLVNNAGDYAAPSAFDEACCVRSAPKMDRARGMCSDLDILG